MSDDLPELEGVPNSLSLWLKQHNISKIHDKLVENGIDSVSDFEEISEVELQQLAQTAGLSLGLKSKLVRAVKTLPNAAINKEKPRHVVVTKAEDAAFQNLMNTRNAVLALHKSLDVDLQDVQKTSKRISKEISDSKKEILQAIDMRFERLYANSKKLMAGKVKKIQGDQRGLLQAADALSQTEKMCSDKIENSTLGTATDKRSFGITHSVSRVVKNANNMMRLQKTATLDFQRFTKEFVQDISNFGSVADAGKHPIKKQNPLPKKNPPRRKNMFEPGEAKVDVKMVDGKGEEKTAEKPLELVYKSLQARSPQIVGFIRRLDDMICELEKLPSTAEEYNCLQKNVSGAHKSLNAAEAALRTFRGESEVRIISLFSQCSTSKEWQGGTSTILGMLAGREELVGSEKRYQVLEKQRQEREAEARKANAEAAPLEKKWQDWHVFWMKTKAFINSFQPPGLCVFGRHQLQKNLSYSEDRQDCEQHTCASCHKYCMRNIYLNSRQIYCEGPRCTGNRRATRKCQNATFRELRCLLCNAMWLWCTENYQNGYGQLAGDNWRRFNSEQEFQDELERSLLREVGNNPKIKGIKAAMTSRINKLKKSAPNKLPMIEYYAESIYAEQ